MKWRLEQRAFWLFVCVWLLCIVQVKLGVAADADTDGDGLPDWWELRYGLPAGNAADGLPLGLTTYYGRYIRPLTIVNQTGQAWSNAEVRFVVDTAGLVAAGKMEPDGRDIRIAALSPVSGATNNLLNYWIESGMNSSSTVIWVRIDQLAAGSDMIYLLYGNPSASAVSDGTKVFRLFDDFNGTNLDSATWGGNAPLSGGVWSGGLRSVAEFDQTEGIVLEYRLYKLAAPEDPYPPDYWYGGFADGASDTTGAFFHWYNHKPQGPTYVAIASDKGSTGWLNTGIQIDATWNTYAQYYSSTKNVLSINNGAWSHTLNGTATGSENVAFGITGSGTRELKFDWIRVRTWIDPQPAVTVSAELVSPYNAAHDPDSDGLTNLQEFQLNTNPLLVDSDGDGLPDGWEFAQGLNPANASDAANVPTGDRLTVSQKYQLNLDPTKPDTDGDGVTDFDELFVFGTDPKVNPNASGQKNNQYYYDKNDRLVGADFANGLLIAYQYDGNGNLVRQTSLSRAASTNGLPPLWKYLNGLSVTNGARSGAFEDADGDGWSNYQEWRAGSSPTDSASLPDLGLPGIKLGSFPWPFAPTNFVVATGQLDGMGADELVIGADGDPAGATNFLYLLSQSPIGWSTQRVDVGAFGITSLAVGRPTNREVPAIYAGLRSATSTGGVMEVRYFGGTWQTNIIAWSTNASAQVLGVRDQQDILATLATTNAPNGAVYGVDFTNDWRVQLFDTNLSHRGLVTTANLVSTNWETLRLLDQGGIQVVRNYRFVSSFLPVPSGAYQRGDSYYFLTEAAMNWTGAQADARLYGGDLVTLEDSNEEAALALQFGDTLWIGLYRESNAPHDASSYRWISGSSSSYRNWGTAGAPNQPSGAANEYYVRKTPDNGPSRWYDEVDTLGGTRGLIEVPATNVPPQIVLMAEPVTSKTNNWYGQNLDIGFARQNYTNAYSVFYAFNDDKNGNDMVDAGDDFVLAEYLVNGTNWTTTTLSRQPISGRRSPAYGLVSLNYTNGGSEVFFTGEPDGRVFAWTATNASGPLYRQPFSGHHAGRAWHALAGVKTPELGEGLVGLRVDPVTPDTCDVIYWPPQSELWQPADVPQTAPLAAIVTPPASGNGIALVNMQQWDAEGNSAQPELQYSTNSGSAWTNATVIAIDGAAPGFVSAPPTGAVHTLTWNAGQDLGASFTNTVLLRARTRDVTLTGDWCVPVNYLVEISAGNPLAVNDVTNTLEDVAVTIPVLANDTVATGTLTVTSVGTPGHGTAVINGDSTITYTPTSNYFGPDGFTYTVSDGVGGTSMAAVAVNVAAVNDPPAAAPYAFQTQEDQTLSLGWGATKDQEGDTVTLSSAGPTTSAGGTAYASGDVITYVPPLNFNGIDTFEYVVIDNGKTAGTNDSKRVTNLVTVTVLAVNDPPVITIPAPQTVNEDTGLVLTNLLISDVDASNAPVRVSFTMTNGTLTLAATNGLTFETGTNGGSQFTFTGTLTDIGSALTNVTFLASSNLNGAGAIRIDADDQGNTGLGGPLTDTKVLIITVNPVNDLPVVTLLSPTNSATFASIDVITLDASALDPDVGGQIIAVEFYEGTNRLTTVNTPPYAFAWTNVPLLTHLTNYALYAKASDDQGGVGYSQTNWINVRPPGLFRINNAQKMASRFALVITGETGQKYSIETSTNLETWTPVTTVTNSTGSVSYEDDLTNNVDRKFYRAKLVR